MRADLVAQVRDVLSTSGFLVSPTVRERPTSFDLLARRDEDLYVVKVLQNVDALSTDVAREMRLIARLLGGKPLLVGLRGSAGALEPGVVYVRHDVPLLSLDTLREFALQGIPILAFAAPGGFYVRLDGERLRQVREERGLSLGHLASVAGVSRRAIRMYESGMSTVVEVAARLEQYLDVPLTMPLDPFDLPSAAEASPAPPVGSVGDPGHRSILTHLTELGLAVAPTNRSPFQALAARKETTIITGVVRDEAVAASRSAVFDALSRVSERRALFVVERGDVPERAGDTPVVTARELDRLDGPDELLRVMKERGAARRA